MEFIKHVGDECPVPIHVWVIYQTKIKAKTKTRTLTHATMQAGKLNWLTRNNTEHQSVPANIIRGYAIVNPPNLPHYFKPMWSNEQYLKIERIKNNE